MKYTASQATASQATISEVTTNRKGISNERVSSKRISNQKASNAVASKTALTLLATLLLLLLLFPVGLITAFATGESTVTDDTDTWPLPTPVVDQAGVLTEEQKAELEQDIQTIRDTYRFDLVIVTTTGLDPDDRQSYADDFYDENGYGYGTDRDGALLLVNVQADKSYTSGNSWISTCGVGIATFSDHDIQEIGADLTPRLESGNYYDAFSRFLFLSRAKLNSAANEYGEWNEDGFFTWGSSSSSDWSSSQWSLSSGGRNYIMILGVALFVGVLGTVIIVIALRRQMISVKTARDASRYVVDGSLYLRQSYDTFLYSNVTRTERPKATNSDNSGFHTSSSGNSHGGGGF